MNQFQKWADTYRPVKNTVAGDRRYEGYLFGLTDPEKHVVQGTANIWTLIETDGFAEIVYGLQHTNRVGYFITEVPYTGQAAPIIRLTRPGRKMTPEREQLALILAEQERAVNTSKDHERDLQDLGLGLIKEEEYRKNEEERSRYIESVRVFFNEWLDEYCIEDVPEQDIPCGRCGSIEPGDPCMQCGRSQPVSLEDYYRANPRVIPLPEPGSEAAEVGEENDLGLLNLMPF